MTAVTIQLPETVLIDPDVIAGEDHHHRTRRAVAGQKPKSALACTIRTGSVLNDAILGDDVTVEPHCVVTQSRLDDRVIIGPFARFAAGQSFESRGAPSAISSNLKKSTIGEGTKAMHLSYLGDAKIGDEEQYRSGHDYLQLRRLPQVSDVDREQGFHRQ